MIARRCCLGRSEIEMQHDPKIFNNEVISGSEFEPSKMFDIVKGDGIFT
jgi:hypothetical protein